MNRLFLTISRFDANHRLLVALCVATVAFLCVPVSFSTPAHLTVVWIAYAQAVLFLMWVSIIVAHPRDLPRLSRIQDSSRMLILAFVVAAAVASLFAVILLLDRMTLEHRTLYIMLAVLAVASAWVLVHTVFTMRYAHLYYGNDPKQTKRPGGLDFPHEPEPDYLDFAYFSFVIGMTSQVSDVAVGSKAMRRTALVHGLLSFGFNAIIIALTISGLSSML
ncbi:DUF1345 domain-containing protein [Spirosoma montaniterrae]|uniref:DUF1345 domain-containing protein n=1 Tax=Spirosoma montaniterrae TaxID=1178516 RepID=A0A1P9WZ29_9BACT|nr:DUF1345 domain-containing protein [Spirosoma montaniterrae]AQG80641.1 hypothetical protein AWR27_15700 [Spirosoma montaniterrae]